MKDLFGEAVGEFKTMRQRYGIWPITVWDCDMSDPQVRKFKKMVGDIGAVKDAKSRSQGTNTSRYKFSFKEAEKRARHETVDGTFGYQYGASVFNPAIAYWLLNLYAPKKGICFDPFAGGGTRAIMAARHGLKYIGYEIRKEECIAVEKRVDNAGFSDRVKIIHGDARYPRKVTNSKADFLITCPPYWNLEKYEGGVTDLSMKESYSEFKGDLFKVVRETFRILKPGSISCWVVGLHRHKNGSLICLNHDVTSMHRKAGFLIKEEIILHIKNTGSLRRVGNFDKGRKFLIRSHEYVLIFKKPEKK